MKKLLIFFACLIGLTAKSQTAIDSVKATVEKMFRAMKSSDTVLLKECFSENAIMETIVRDKAGATSVRSEKLADFLGAIGKMPKDAADERISFDVVKVDGPLAIVWTPYKFYFNGQFSHCGVNSFQVVRIRGEWRIQYIIDTRRKQGCE